MALTLQELKLVAGADAGQLPGLLVHVIGWTVDPIYDVNGDIHMNPRQLEFLRASLPIELVGNEPERPGVIRYRIALRPDHLVGGVNDHAAPLQVAGERRQLVRDVIATGTREPGLDEDALP